MRKDYVAQRIRNLRMDNNLTLRAMHERTGLPMSKIHSLEKANGKSLTVDEARVISRAFDDLPITYLLGLDLEDDLVTGTRPALKTKVITEDDIVQRLKVDCSLNEQEALDFLRTWFDELRASVNGGENVTLGGFGSFYIKKSDSKEVKFKPNTRLKAMLYSASKKKAEEE